MTTLIEVLDTAVKIGLGAGISAVAAYWHGRQKAKTESAKSLNILPYYKSKIIANIITNETVNHAYLKYWALAVEFVRVRSRDESWPEERKQKMDVVKEELFTAFSEITSAESKLLLVNETEAYEKIRELGDTIVKFLRMNLEARENLNEQEMLEIRDRIRGIRNELYQILSGSYQTNFT